MGRHKRPLNEPRLVKLTHHEWKYTLEHVVPRKDLERIFARAKAEAESSTDFDPFVRIEEDINGRKITFILMRHGGGDLSDILLDVKFRELMMRLCMMWERGPRVSVESKNPIDLEESRRNLLVGLSYTISNNTFVTMKLRIDELKELENEVDGAKKQQCWATSDGRLGKGFSRPGTAEVTEGEKEERRVQKTQ